jgi:YHS domain-containing protein
MWKAVRAALGIVCFTAMACLPALAKDAPIYTRALSSKALSGYDAVAYFTDGKPIKGNVRFATTYKGAKWIFVTAENRDKFSAAPEQFAPQYGGYCAWAVAQGYTASSDPLAWRIVSNKLYLNYDAEIQKKWEASMAELIQKADINWPKVLR